MLQNKLFPSLSICILLVSLSCGKTHIAANSDTLKNDTAIVNEVIPIDTLSVVKSHCKCTPITYRYFSQANKIMYLKEMPENNSGFSEKLKLLVLEQIEDNWVEIFKFEIDPEFDLSRLASDSIANKNVTGIQYAYFVIMNAYSGVAFNGLQIHSFYFYNTKSDEIITIRYEYVSGQAFGEYKPADNKPIKNYKQFIPVMSEFVEHYYGNQNTDIDDPSNFNLKWESLNENIYDQLDNYINTDRYINIKFPKYDKIFYDNQFANDPNHPKEFRSDKYKVFAGYVSPIFLFSKAENASYVLYIPQGWPTGSEWAYRSFNIEKISNDLIVASNEDIILEILFATGKIRSYSKNPNSSNNTNLGW